MSFDPWVLPLWKVELTCPLPPDEVERRMSGLIATGVERPSEDRPFRGAIEHRVVALTVRAATSGLAAHMTQHERALLVVEGTIEERPSGSELQLLLRQPLPAFVVLALVWLGFIFSVAGGASPTLLFMPLSGHTLLLVFFRVASHTRVLGPLNKTLGAKLSARKLP